MTLLTLPSFQCSPVSPCCPQCHAHWVPTSPHWTPHFTLAHAQSLNLAPELTSLPPAPGHPEVPPTGSSPSCFSTAAAQIDPACRRVSGNRLEVPFLSPESQLQGARRGCSPDPGQPSQVLLFLLPPLLTGPAECRWRNQPQMFWLGVEVGGVPSWLGRGLN